MPAGFRFSHTIVSHSSSALCAGEFQPQPDGAGVSFLKSGSQIGDGDAQILIGKTGEPARAAPEQIGCRGLVSHEPFEMSGGKLDKPLEELSLPGLRSGGMPERFKDLMTFPPIGKIEEIDPISIGVGLGPGGLVEGGRFRFYVPIRMSARMSSGMRSGARDEPVGWKGTS